HPAPATTYSLSLHDALPISNESQRNRCGAVNVEPDSESQRNAVAEGDEHQQRRNSPEELDVQRRQPTVGADGGQFHQGQYHPDRQSDTETQRGIHHSVTQRPGKNLGELAGDGRQIEERVANGGPIREYCQQYGDEQQKGVLGGAKHSGTSSCRHRQQQRSQPRGVLFTIGALVRFPAEPLLVVCGVLTVFVSGVEYLVDPCPKRVVT